MAFSRLDAFFHMASQGDKESFSILYNTFYKKCTYAIKETTRNITKYAENPIDFAEKIDSLFFRTINEYEIERGPFRYYVEYVIFMRFIPYVKDKTMLVSLNEETGKLIYEEFELGLDDMEDRDSPTIQEAIALDKFRFQIASPIRTKSNSKRLNDKVMLLLLGGCTNSEICRQLKISRGKLRQAMDSLKKDQDLLNLKLEIK